MRAFRLVGACAVLFAAPAFADTIQLGASKDNTIYENSGSLSNGAGEHFFAGRAGLAFDPIRRGLIAFDLSAIPAGATIDNVTLRLNMSRTNTLTGQAVGLHRALDDWGEGTSDAAMGEGGGAPATMGDATWLHRFWPSDLWAATGGDFDPVASGTRVIADSGSYDFNSTPQLVADVQHWLDVPAENFGWLVKGVEASGLTAKRFDSRQNLIEANRPVLTVEYTPSGVGVGDRTPATSLLQLLPVAPNPSSEQVNLRYRLGEAGRVRIGIYDTRGREVARLEDADLPAGDHVAGWSGVTRDGVAAAPGTYWARAEFAGYVATRRFVFTP